MNKKFTRRTFAKTGAAATLGLLGSSRAAYGAEPEWRVGLAGVKITPEGPVSMSGYGRRVSQGVLDDLYAKAMAIEHADGGRAVLVTADLLFFRAPFAEALCKRIMAKTGLKRRQILLNASHTHSGPVFGVKDPDIWDLTEDQRNTADIYTEKLQGQLVDLVVAALADMKPSRLSWGMGNAGNFVMNRRLMTPEGKCRGMGPNPQGPVDRNVPVLRVDRPDGQLRAVVFGCACHPVTLDGRNRKISADYAGFAQQYIEEQHPGVQAMFMIGCGGDANSHPRGGADQEQLTRRHGKSLGAEVCRVASGKLQPVRGPLRVELEWAELPLEHSYSRQRLQQMTDEGSRWHRRNARGMLEILDRKEPLPTHYPAPIALWQFGDDLTMVALSGEAVAEYVAMIEKALGPERLWIAAYCNESFGYLPTAKMLPEGGHETMCLTLAIGFFSPKVEDVVINTARQLAQKVGRTLPRTSGLVVYPEKEWIKITPEQAGLDMEKFDELLALSNVHGGGWGGVKVDDHQWGAVLTRNGYLVHSWGDPTYKCQSASLGKCITRALFGLSVEAGLLEPDEPIHKTWTGLGQLSHPHKYLDQGLHRRLTWRHLLEHQGGFVLESGGHWRTRTALHARIPAGVKWTGDPLFDNHSHNRPGSTTRYSSGGYWRLGQALTALWDKDLKQVLQERLFGHLGIPADRWDWLPGKVVHDTKDFYPAIPHYGEYVGPPYEINGHVVRGCPGWIVMSSEDLARFGLLIATRGIWKGKRLIGAEWLRGHAGLDIHVVAGDPESMVSIAKINTKGFPFGREVGTSGRFSFPKELIVGPVVLQR